MILVLQKEKWGRIAVAMLMTLFFSMPVFSQNARTVQGLVLDAQNNPVVGSTIQVKQTTNSTSTNNEGRFSIPVPAGRHVLVISYVGKASQEITLGNQNDVVITLKDSSADLDAVVVVGYGRQKKESVVAAISQTSGKVLQRAGGVSNIGAALTGNVPGVITVQGTGLPGAEDPTIYIRGQGTWNNSGPLILVDGIERSMNGVDIGSVESISILKDATATAVFGVKGANGVVLITTKRGVEGKANINVTVNSTMKFPSRLPQKYDSYDALMIRNKAIERELAINPSSWQDYTPQSIIEKYRHPLNAQEAQQYPNVDWQQESLKKMAMAQNANVNISGGSRVCKIFYFC